MLKHIDTYRTWEDQHHEYEPPGLKHVVIVGEMIHLLCTGDALIQNERSRVTDDVPTCLQCFAAWAGPD